MLSHHAHPPFSLTLCPTHSSRVSFFFIYTQIPRVSTQFCLHNQHHSSSSLNSPCFHPNSQSNLPKLHDFKPQKCKHHILFHSLEILNRDQRNPQSTMPLRWKKTTRCTRFSQLIADHLQSRKRGGSLVVQTGFPTSLIDLYFRNRAWFRKFPEKKPSAGDSSLASSLNSSSVDLDCRGSDQIVEKGVTFDVDVNVMDGDVSEKIENLNWVLMIGLKVFLMAVLALGTKRFTVGITVLAFVLYFLEFVGKPWMQRLRLFRPCLDPRKLFKSHVRGTRIIKSLEVNLAPVVCNEVLEIEEVVEDSEQEIVTEKELDEVLVEVMQKSARRAKMKLKMLRLLPKKLRSSNKCCLDSKHGKLVGSRETMQTILLKSYRLRSSVAWIQNAKSLACSRKKMHRIPLKSYEPRSCFAWI